MTAQPLYPRIEASNVFRRNRDAYNASGVKIIVNQGGTRSGKTYSILQLLVSMCIDRSRKPFSVSVVSLNLPHLRRGAIRDFKHIMDGFGIWSDNNFNRSNLVYTFSTGSYIEFFAVDDPGKARGPGRDILFVNEANLVEEETFEQLLYRTRGKVFVDYNPADEFHWLYDHVLTRHDCHFIQSTYLDNPFLPRDQVREIELIKERDANKWRIYGMGERGISEGMIYTHWELGQWDEVTDWCYGLDFGYNHPTALVRCGFADGLVVWEQVIYESGLHNVDLIARMKQDIPRDEWRRKKIYCDSARPDFIEEIRRAGFVAEKAVKDVAKGIDYVKGRRLIITRNSVDLLKEVKSYKYKQDSKTGAWLDDPVKMNDDGMDAGRYAVASYLHRPAPNAAFGTLKPNRYGI